MNIDSLDALILELMEGEISPENFQRLEAELLSNPKARSRYHAFVDLENLLQIQVGIDLSETANASAIEMAMSRQRRKVFAMALLSAAALLLFAGVILRLVIVAQTPSGLAFETSPGTVFTVSHSDSEQPPEGGKLASGSRMELTQGVAELEFGNGVRAVVVAPADLTLQADDRLLLKEGTAWFDVPKQAVGFQVITDQIDVVDLGTRFGVIARKRDHDEVHVIHGAVRASGRKKSEILLAGQARRVDPIGRLDEIPMTANAFIDSLPASLPHLYWSFDEIRGDQFTTGGTFPNSREIPATLEGADSSDRLVPGRKGRALSLDGINNHVVADWQGFGGNRPRSVSLWVRLDPSGNYQHKAGLVGWGNEVEGRLNSKWKLVIFQAGPGAPAMFRLSWGAAWLDGTTNLADGHWHHLVATTDGGIRDDGYPAAELYVNGKIEPANYHRNPGQDELPDINTLIHDNDSVPLIIGASLSPSPEGRLHFKGEIDELHIFDGHITESEVRRLHSQ